MFGASVSLWCIVLLILLTLTKDCVVALQLQSPATDFIRHRIVLPKVHHGRSKRQISSTKDTSGVHHSEVEMTVSVDDEEYILELQLNHDLLPDGHTVRYQKDGKTVLYKPRKEEIDLCQYHGTVRGKPFSRVALSTCHGVRGIIFDGEKTRYIEPAEGGEIQSQHYLYDHSDLNTNFHCGYKGRVQSNLTRTTRSANKYKRHADDIQIHGPYNENKQSRYVELVLVADNREFKASGENIGTVHRQLKDLTNIINSVFSPLNIFIALVGVVVWNERDEIQIEENSELTLKKFLEYRRTRLVVDIPNDNAQLLTRQIFQNAVIGLGSIGGICSRINSGGLANSYLNAIGLVAGTVAHEMGHNFGMGHDSYDTCECPDKTCIMCPYLSQIMRHWSSCSLISLALTFKEGKDFCLRNKPKRLFSSPTCGNGFVEPGEQCDCGHVVGEGDNSACVACCHPDTCMLRSNATCGAGTCCDLQTCRPKSAGTMCRSADRECDLPEYCTGHSEYCPDDVYKMDTTPCGDNEMCLKQRCEAVETVRSDIAVRESSVCPSDCSGHGICNSEGHCHCEAGFAPPLCALPGVGGSIDSGPATDLTIQRNFMVAMYVIFLGIVPLILLIAFFIYYYRHNVLFWGKTPRKSYVNFLLCTGCTGTAYKEYFTNKFSRFQNSTSSLRNLLSFKRKPTINVDIKEPPQKTLDISADNIKQPQLYNKLSLSNKNTKTPINKPPRKINKDDIQIVSGKVSDVKPKAPMPPPKPKVIIKQGLVSTTNEMVAKGQKNNIGLYDIRNSGLYANCAGQSVKVHGLKK